MAAAFGGAFAHAAREMNTPHPLDGQPGSEPEIHAHDDSVTFSFDVANVRQGAVLIVRCDEDGNVWVAIEYGR